MVKVQNLKIHSYIKEKNTSKHARFEVSPTVEVCLYCNQSKEGGSVLYMSAQTMYLLSVTSQSACQIIQ